MQKHPTHKSAKGFTLIELVIAVAIIGILTSVAVLGYNQYKVRGYDAHSKQALKDMHLLCNAYWLDTDPEQGCDLPIIKGTYYGFNQNADVVATLPPSPLDNFCASAKHNSSPNTFSIDSASLISSGSDCSGAGGSVQTASFSGKTEEVSKFESCESQSYKGPLTANQRGKAKYLEELPTIKEVFIPEKYFKNAGSPYAGYPGDDCRVEKYKTGRISTRYLTARGLEGMPEWEYNYDNLGCKGSDGEPLEYRGWCVSAISTPNPGYAHRYRIGIRRPGCTVTKEVRTRQNDGKFLQSFEQVPCDYKIVERGGNIPIAEFIVDTEAEVEWESPLRRLEYTSENACSLGPHIMRDGECVPITESTPICPKENIPHPTQGQRYGTDPMDFYLVQGIICRKPYWREKS